MYFSCYTHYLYHYVLEIALEITCVFGSRTFVSCVCRKCRILSTIDLVNLMRLRAQCPGDSSLLPFTAEAVLVNN